MELAAHLKDHRFSSRSLRKSKEMVMTGCKRNRRPSANHTPRQEALVRRGESSVRKPADEERREEIAQREYEGEGCAGEQAREWKEQDDAEKCLNRSGAQVVRGFDKRAGDVFECRVDGKRNESV